MRAPLTGFFARASADPALRQLLGEKAPGVARIYFGWPDERVDAADFPRLTYFLASGAPVRPGVYTAQVQVDVWVWPTGERGGVGALAEIAERLVELFDEADWHHGGAYLYATAAVGRDFPAEAGRPLRRLQPLRIDARRVATAPAA